jgi:hypothetical protein
MSWANDFAKPFCNAAQFFPLEGIDNTGDGPERLPTAGNPSVVGRWPTVLYGSELIQPKVLNYEYC